MGIFPENYYHIVSVVSKILGFLNGWTDIHHFTLFYGYYIQDSSVLEGIIVINATILMTLGSIFISTFNSVPPSSYVKMIDIWMITVLIYPVIVITIHTIIHGLSGNKRNRIIIKMMRMFLDVALPLIFLLFTVCYWTVGLGFVSLN